MLIGEYQFSRWSYLPTAKVYVYDSLIDYMNDLDFAK